MAYIGNTVQNQGFTPAIDYFSGNGSTVTFTLSRPLVSVAQVIAVIENVPQNPSTAFTVTGNSITFTSAPPSGTNNIWVEYTSLITQYNAISQDPSIIGDITASGGFLSTGDFGNTFTDGTIVDYVTGNARITTGPADGVTIYNGGPSARTALMAIDSSGKVGIGTTTAANKLVVSDPGATYIQASNTSGTPSNVFMGAAGADNVIISRDGTTGDKPLSIYIGTAERARFLSSGGVAIGNTVDLGIGSLSINNLVSWNATSPNFTLTETAATTYVAGTYYTFSGTVNQAAIGTSFFAQFLIQFGGINYQNCIGAQSMALTYWKAAGTLTTWVFSMEQHNGDAFTVTVRGKSSTGARSLEWTPSINIPITSGGFVQLKLKNMFVA